MNLTVSVTQYAAFVAYLRVLLQQPAPGVQSTLYQTTIIFYDRTLAPFDAIVDTLHSVGLPTRIYPFETDYHPAVLRQHTQMQLYMFLYASEERLNLTELVFGRLQAVAHRLVYVQDASDSVDRLEELAEHHLNVLQRYLLVRSDGVVLWRRNHVIRMQVDLFDVPEVKALMQRVYAASVNDLAAWTATVFVHYYPPFSMLSPMYDEHEQLELIGTDTLMAYDIARSLNATVRMCTDVQQVDASFRKWFSPEAAVSPYGKDLGARLFSKRVVLQRPADEFDFDA